MKKIQIILVTLCLIMNQGFSQDGEGGGTEDCLGITGPGANGTITNCSNGTETYFTNGCCGTTGSWNYSIGGSIDLDYLAAAADPNYFPFAFNDGSIAGVVISATSNSIKIDWDCSSFSCCDGIILTTLEACGNDFNPIIRIQCPPCEPIECDMELLTCVKTSCGCIKICVNGFEVEYVNNTGGYATFCFPEGTVIGDIGECGFPLETCNNSLKAPEGGKQYIEIPDAKIITKTPSTGEINLSIELPESVEAYNMVISNALGSVIKTQKVNTRKAQINLTNLNVGVYFIVLSNGTTTISHKFIVRN